MTTKRFLTVDGNEAAASVAFRTSEVIAIYPITPASPMGEFSDEWAARDQKNIWGLVPSVSEMQSEGGAAGAIHGALQAGALATTFTASQGLLLMIPNMYKIAGELTPFVLHVAARSLASHALSIFGDHSDVMSCRSTGFAMLSSCSVQEAHDMAAVSHCATLKSRVPFLHFFDGFRTSHELSKIEEIPDSSLMAMLPEDLIKAHRARSLSPEHPVIRGTAQNPDTFFQAREACNSYYNAVPAIVEESMAQFAELTGRKYGLMEYSGAADADRVIVAMGSGTETIRTTVDALNKQGEKVGMVLVRLYRPFPVEQFIAALPKSVKKIAVLDRTKEPGCTGEPLYQDVLTALYQGSPSSIPAVTRGRYGLSSKEFTPAMVKGVFDELKKEAPKQEFTIGIVDDVTHLSLDYDPSFLIREEGMVQALFFGLGSDGTVGANKNTIKIIGSGTDSYIQGYFVYDSKKAGAITVSHLRFGPKPIYAPYLLQEADFVACHQFQFLEQYDVLETSKEGSVFLVNSPVPADQCWDQLPRTIQQQIITKKLRFYAIDAYTVARDAGMGSRINTVMQTCFFAISGVLPREMAIEKIKQAIEKTYGKKGAEVVRKNQAAVDQTLANLHEIQVPAAATSTMELPPVVPDYAPELVKKVTSVMMAGKGDLLPVSAFPVDGTWPLGTTKWEKRNIAAEIPAWDPSICIQCNKCSFVCPHAAIRTKVYDEEQLAGAPEGYQSVPFKGGDFKGQPFTIQVAPEDCTGCGVCVTVCPAKDKSNPKHKALDMVPQRPVREVEKAKYEFFLGIPDVDRTKLKLDVKHSQFMLPLFEYSGACAGCGETPYVKLLSQLFGDRAVIANATGCSSIYGGNLPTTPYTTDKNGRGPAWANSLFEDNAEFGFGLRLGVDAQNKLASHYIQQLASKVGEELVKAILTAPQGNEVEIAAQRERIEQLRAKIAGDNSFEATRLNELADYLVKRSVWILGGDGWAYDIGFGGLDHVLASDQDVNILVMDTGVYSNTGGQQSKATPIGAAAKFAAAGKAIPKKDLGLIAMSYPNTYVAQVAFGAKDAQVVKAFVEAEAHKGPSIIIAYSHCVAHGFDLAQGTEHQKMAVDSGLWPLFRCDPARAANGENPLVLDGGQSPKSTVREFAMSETRFRMIEKMNPKRFADLQEAAQLDATRRTEVYRQMAEMRMDKSEGGEK
jgi:pyruvate-ferredoxin/flavodoxin oxidoreductase